MGFDLEEVLGKSLDGKVLGPPDLPLDALVEVVDIGEGALVLVLHPISWPYFRSSGGKAFTSSPATFSARLSRSAAID